MRREFISYSNLYYLFILSICLPFTSYAQCTEINNIKIGSTAFLYGVAFTNETTGYIVGDSGIILKTIDGGSSWKNVASPVKYSLQAIQFVNSTNGYIVGDSGSVLKTTTGGNSWQALNFPEKVLLTTLSFITPDIGYVGGGNNHYVWKTRDGGTSWTAEQINLSNGGSPNFAVSLCFTDTATGYMVSGYLWLGKACSPLSSTINGSASWAEKDCIYPGWSFVNFTDKNTGFAGGNGIVKTTDAFGSYTTVSKVQGLYAISFEANNGYAVGNAIVKTTDGGTTWDSLAYASDFALSAVYTISNGNAIAVGPFGTVLKISSNCPTVATSVTGISAPNASDFFNVYPNPNSGSFTIRTSAGTVNSNVKVYNGWGQEIKSLFLAEQETTIDMGTVSPGIYYINFSSGSEKSMQKIIVQQ